MRKQGRARRVTLPLLLLVAACEDGDERRELPPFSWEGDHLRFAQDDPDARICSGTLPYLDAYVGVLQSRVQDGPPMIDYYYLVAHSYDDYGVCQDGEAWACANEERVFSRVVPQEHELVHAVRPNDFEHDVLGEGVAELWGDDAPWRPPLGGDLVELLQRNGEPLDLEDYVLAGHFVSYLVSAEGGGRFEEMMNATADDTSFAELEQIFTTVYGRSVTDMVAEYEAVYPPCEHDEYRLPAAECAAVPALVLDCSSDPMMLEVQVECENDEAVGPRDDEIWRNAVVAIAETGTYYMWNVGTPASTADWVRLKSCAGTCGSFEQVIEVGDGVGQNGYIDLDAGLYTLRFTRPEGEPGTIQLSLGGACN